MHFRSSKRKKDRKKDSSKSSSKGDNKKVEEKAAFFLGTEEEEDEDKNVIAEEREQDLQEIDELDHSVNFKLGNVSEADDIEKLWDGVLISHWIVAIKYGGLKFT